MEHPNSFYRGQTVFLTGATGGLGGCLLFKLVLAAETEKIYVLIRSSPEVAMAQWRKTMPQQIDSIFATGKVHLVFGNITEPQFGIKTALLSEMAGSVTLIIHSAANTHWLEGLPVTMHNNCLPTLDLASMATKFTHRVRFCHISTAYANSDRPDGPIEERIYRLGDPEAQLAEILASGTVSGVDITTFLAPYCFAKHLTEELLLSRYSSSLSIVIIRPTGITSAVF
ncbi:male sterility protein-domain-containing protein [Mycena metata]|uniref:Fatty acyl-CoA reductase n=1 Tax=Mycena metata TaxID=1033252 RepID=A0AAD7N6E5_9AGAR|nr:male sterility protein-domain-containing protein [Mycena metata]